MPRFFSFLIFPLFLLLCFSCGQQAAKAPVSEPVSATTSGPQAPHVGIWSGPEKYPLVEIVQSGDGFIIRECYGDMASRGVVYPGVMRNGKIVASGRPEDFYKYELPAFGLVSNNGRKMMFMSGVGEVELLKVDGEKMPDIPYDAPVNND